MARVLQQLESGTITITMTTRMKGHLSPQTVTLVFSLDENSEASLRLDHALERAAGTSGYNVDKPTGLSDFSLELKRVKEIA